VRHVDIVAVVVSVQHAVTDDLAVGDALADADRLADGHPQRAGVLLDVCERVRLEESERVVLRVGERGGVPLGARLGNGRAVAVGDRLDAQITNIDKAARRVSLSVKALEMAEDKAAIEQFGSSDSGASLGDILGAALREKASKE
jgi:hypothetical protein